MKNEAVAAIGIDQAIFRAPPETGHLSPGEPLAKVDGERPAQVRPARLDVVDALSEQDSLEPAHGGFDFGKLRHGRDMAEPPQAR
jgi:hypothetical protein